MRAWIAGLAALGAVSAPCGAAGAASVPPHANGLIAFAADPCGGYGCATIYVTDQNGTTARPIAQQQLGAQLPSFSPDGFHVAYSGFALAVTDLTGENDFPVVPLYGGTSSWTPDAQHLVFTSGGSVDQTDLAGHVTTSFTPPPQQPGSGNGLRDASVSPDGRRVALELGTAPVEPNTAHAEIFVANIDGSNLHEVTNTPGGAYPGGFDGAGNPRWSPDGTTLVYTTYPSLSIVTTSVSGGAPTVLKAGGGVYYNGFFDPSFSPDGTEIVFDGPNGMARMNADGSGQQPIPAANALFGSQPSWGPSPSCAVLAAYPTAYAGFNIGACANASFSTG
jgi:Tol biopolymer transport system component